MILERASGHPVYQLDLWMGGEAHCRDMLWRAAQEADLILVEGVMGLYDGMSSSADLAMRLGLPVMAVIDGASKPAPPKPARAPRPATPSNQGDLF